eukprot:s1646_g4.t1
MILWGDTTATSILRQQLRLSPTTAQLWPPTQSACTKCNRLAQKAAVSLGFTACQPSNSIQDSLKDRCLPYAARNFTLQEKQNLECPVSLDLEGLFVNPSQFHRWNAWQTLPRGRPRRMISSGDLHPELRPSWSSPRVVL